MIKPVHTVPPAASAGLGKNQRNLTSAGGRKARKANRTASKANVSHPVNKRGLAVRRGSKKAKILALLERPGGASLKELQKATGWQPHSVRGFISGQLKAKMALAVDLKQRGDGSRAYLIRSK